jgi:hypothetical protein
MEGFEKPGRVRLDSTGGRPPRGRGIGNLFVQQLNDLHNWNRWNSLPKYSADAMISYS